MRPSAAPRHLRRLTVIMGIVLALAATACVPPPGGSDDPSPVAPTAVATADPGSGRAPVTVAFSSAGSAAAEGELVSYSWAFGDGGTSVESDPTHVYGLPGTYVAQLTVTDEAGATATAAVGITVTGVPAPTGLRQTFRDCGGFFATTCDIVVAWDAVPQVDRYEVEFDTANIACPGSNQLHTTTGTNLSTNVCKSVLANAYANVFWKVRARDSITGQWSPWSARIQVEN